MNPTPAPPLTAALPTGEVVELPLGYLYSFSLPHIQGIVRVRRAGIDDAILWDLLRAHDLHYLNRSGRWIRRGLADTDFESFEELEEAYALSLLLES